MAYFFPNGGAGAATTGVTGPRGGRNRLPSGHTPRLKNRRVAQGWVGMTPPPSNLVVNRWD